MPSFKIHVNQLITYNYSSTSESATRLPRNEEARNCSPVLLMALLALAKCIRQLLVLLCILCSQLLQLTEKIILAYLRPVHLGLQLHAPFAQDPSLQAELCFCLDGHHVGTAVKKHKISDSSLPLPCQPCLLPGQHTDLMGGENPSSKHKPTPKPRAPLASDSHSKHLKAHCTLRSKGCEGPRTSTTLWGNTQAILWLYGDDEKENGNY